MLETINRLATSVKPLNRLIGLVADRVLPTHEVHASCTQTQPWVEKSWRYGCYLDDRCVGPRVEDEGERSCYRGTDCNLHCTAWFHNGNWRCC